MVSILFRGTPTFTLSFEVSASVGEYFDSISADIEIHPHLPKKTNWGSADLVGYFLVLADTSMLGYLPKTLIGGLRV